MSARDFLAGEKGLLIAARDAIRAGGYKDHECEIEFDELAPATVGQTYLIVLTGGWTPGPRHHSSGGVNDLYYAVSVLIVKRISNVPMDRRRDIFLTNLGCMNVDIDAVFTAVDFQYDLLQRANKIIEAETDSTEGFTEPLRFTGMDQKPRLAAAELFTAKPGEHAAGLIRGIHFGNARRITHKA